MIDPERLIWYPSEMADRAAMKHRNVTLGYARIVAMSPRCGLRIVVPVKPFLMASSSCVELSTWTTSALSSMSSPAGTGLSITELAGMVGEV